MSNESIKTESDAASRAAVVMRGVVREVVNGPTCNGRPLRLLDGIDLMVPRCGMLHVVGPSGAGKSSLIRLMNHLDPPTAGRIEVLGRAIDRWPPRRLRQRVAMVFQEPSLLYLTVRENLRLPFRLSGSEPADIGLQIEKAIRLVGLDTGVLEREAAQLSVGQKQRVTLARALITEPDILLLDEPTAALDPRTAEQLLASLAALQRRRSLAIVMVTHRLAEARQLGGQMLVLIDGRAAALGDVNRLLSRPPDGEVRDFLQGAAGHGATI